MKDSDLKKLNEYLDIIVLELNKVAKITGHPSYEEFTKQTTNNDKR